jgi:hypothetical protein
MMPLTPGRRAMLTFGVPLSLAFIGYGALGIVNAVGLTHYSESVTLHPVTNTISVDAKDGSVRLIASPDGDVHVLEHGVYSLSKPRLSAVATAHGVTVVGRQCAGGVFICSQELVVQVPASFKVSAKSSGGDVRTMGLTGDLTLTSSAGDVHVDGSAGRLTMSSSAGDVDGTNLRSSDVTASSSAGDVDLRFVVGPTRVEAGSSAGDVVVRVPGAVAYHVTTRTSAGDTKSTVHEDSTSSRIINAHSSAGDVTVEPVG